jgi:hypothetical protein
LASPILPDHGTFSADGQAIKGLSARWFQAKSAKKYEGVYASDARAIDDEELCAFAGCSEPISGHTFRDHEPVKFQAPVTAEDAIELSEPDPDGDAVDTAEEVLDQAPWTVAPPYDDNDLARLFGDEPETKDQSLADDLADEEVCMTEAEAVAVIPRAFPGATRQGCAWMASDEHDLEAGAARA